MNDNVLRIRLPSTLSSRLKERAAEFGRSSSDMTREAVILHLRRLETQFNNAANMPPDPPRAA